MTALDDFVMAFVRIGRDMSVPIPVRNFATNCRDRLQEYILASSERREPPAASVSEPAAMSDIRAQICAITPRSTEYRQKW